MASSFLEVIVLMFLPLLQGGGKVDLLSLIDPQAALESLGEPTDDATIAKLLAAGGAADLGGGAGYDKKEVENAIQNLASSTESVRDKARAKLVSVGQALRARLDEVVAGDARRAEQAKLVLAQLDLSRASADRKQVVARILAIRVAQDRKLSTAIPSLKDAARSEDQFLSSAAKRALAVLEKEPSPKAQSAASVALCAAVEALPKATRVFLGILPRGEGVTDLRIEGLLKNGLLSGAGMPPDLLEREIKKAQSEITRFVVSYGNMRISGVYVANVGGVGPQGGGVAIIATGDYEPKVLEAGLANNTSFWTVSEVQSRKVYTSVGGRILLLDEHTVLFLPSEASKHFPLSEFLTSFAGSKKTLRSDARWAKFLETLSGPAVARGLAITDSTLMSEIQNALEHESGAPSEVATAVKGMKELELDVVALEGTKARYRLEGVFTEAEHSKSLCEYLKTQIQTGIQELEQAVAQFNIPAMKIPLQILKSIQVSSDGNKGVLRLELDVLSLVSTLGTATLDAPQTVEEAESDSDP